MAIKVQGTTVIDDSRNIINVDDGNFGGIVTATTFDGQINAGVSTITANSSSPALSITQTGSGSAILIEDESSDSTPFVVTGVGSVGIGTTNPTQKLEINGNISLIDGNSYNVTFQTQPPTIDRIITIPDATGVLGLVAGVDRRIQFNNSGYLGASTAFNYDYDSESLLIGTGNTTGTINQYLQVAGGAYIAGNLGIGLTNPSAKLDIAGDIKVSGSATITALDVNKISSDGSDFGQANYVLTSGGPSGNISWQLVTDVGAGVLDAVFIRQDGSNVGTGSATTFDFYENFSVTQPSAGIASVRLADTLNLGGLNVTGVSTFGGNVYLGDDDRLIFGAGSDLQIFHNSSNNNSVIQETGTGSLILAGNEVHIRNAGANTDLAKFIPGGAVELYYDNSKKFETTADGILVNPNVGLGTVAGDSQDLAVFQTTNSNTSKLKIVEERDVDGTSWTSAYTRIQKTIDVTDQAYIQFNGADNTYGLEFGTNVDEKFAQFIRNGAVELYYDNSKKFETTDYGIYVTGAGNTSTIGGAANLVLDPSTVGDNTGTVTILGNLQVEGTQTIINSTTLEVDDKLVSIAKSATNASQADGAGLEINGASATLTYASTGDKWVFNKEPYYNTDRLLTTADEGTGNGLDADTLDTLEASQFLRSDAADTGTGLITLTNGLNVTGGDVGIGTDNPGSKLAVNGYITESNDGGTNYWNVVTQSDIGYGAAQVPLNQYLGQLAFLDDYHPNGLRRDGGGVDDVVVSAGGSVGIGTDNPTVKLDVRGHIRVTDENSNEGGEIRFGAVGDGIRLFKDSSNNNFYLHQGTSSGDGLYLGSAGSVYVSIDTNNNDNDTKAFIIQKNGLQAGTEIFRVAENGNVGIGTDNPTATLDVNGTIAFNSTLTAGQNGKIVFPDNTTIPDDPSNQQHDYITFGAGGSISQVSGRGALMITSSDDSLILANGDVGRGFTSSNINADSENISLLSDGPVWVKTDLQNGWGTENTYTFAGGDIEATTFTSTQATGTAPFTVSSTTVVNNLNADKLDGQEGSYYTNASNINAGTLAIARGGTNSSATPTNGGVAYGTGSAYEFTAAGTSGKILTSNGAAAPTWEDAPGGFSVTNDTSTNSTYYPVFVDTTSGDPTQTSVSSTKLNFNPSTGNFSATQFTTLSDISKKTNIRPVENALEITKQLEGVRFDWIDNDKPSVGLIAQQVEEVLPELVETSDDGIKSVSYGNIIGVLVEAIKEQQKLIDKLMEK